MSGGVIRKQHPSYCSEPEACNQRPIRCFVVECFVLHRLMDAQHHIWNIAMGAQPDDLMDEGSRPERTPAATVSFGMVQCLAGTYECCIPSYK